jgi:Ca2+-binding RTX toxin-like protein
VSVDIDGIADDGPAGEGDNVQVDVENIGGAGGDDVLIGNDAANVITGGPIGNAGADHDMIMGLGGNDVIEGRHGNDVVEGGNGDDSVKGGLDDDDLRGGAGLDGLFGEEGDDILTGGEDLDSFICGPGSDTVTDAQRSESPGADCEIFGHI